MGAEASQEQIRRNAQELLQPGEEIQVAIFAQAFNPLLMLPLLPVIYFAKPLRPIVVTNRRILVFRSGGFGPLKLSVILEDLPRSTRIGPASGRLWYRTTALGHPIYFYPSVYSQIAVADGAAGLG